MLTLTLKTFLQLHLYIFTNNLILNYETSLCIENRIFKPKYLYALEKIILLPLLKSVKYNPMFGFKIYAQTDSLCYIIKILS